MSNERPGEAPPQFATGGVWTTGPDAGLANRQKPTSGEIAEGWHPNYKPPAGKHNYTVGTLCDWVGYLSDVPIANWRDTYLKDDAGAALAITSFRPDGSGKALFGEGIQKWIVLGATTPTFYVEYSEGALTKFSTGATYGAHHGVDFAVIGKLVLFASDGPGAGSRLKYATSGTPVYNLASWSLATLPGTVTTGARCLDSLISPDGSWALAFGGIDNNHLCWRSSNGTSWTSVVIKTPVVLANDFVGRAFIGKNGRVFAYIPKASNVNDGNKLFYSDDQGATWTMKTLSFANIADACYVPGKDSYVFAIDGTQTVVVVDNPVTGSPNTITVGRTIIQLAAYGGLVLGSVAWNSGFTANTGTPILATNDLFATARQIMYVFDAGSLTPQAVYLGCAQGRGQFAYISSNAFRTSMRSR